MVQPKPGQMWTGFGAPWRDARTTRRVAKEPGQDLGGRCRPNSNPARKKVGRSWKKEGEGPERSRA